MDIVCSFQLWASCGLQQRCWKLMSRRPLSDLMSLPLILLYGIILYSFGPKDCYRTRSCCGFLGPTKLQNLGDPVKQCIRRPFGHYSTDCCILRFGVAWKLSGHVCLLPSAGWGPEGYCVARKGQWKCPGCSGQGKAFISLHQQFINELTFTILVEKEHC